jgi:hypothetical protein
MANFLINFLLIMAIENLKNHFENSTVNFFNLAFWLHIYI